MADRRADAPLAALKGARPPAPGWFTDALAHAPARGFVTVDGARIETLSWGDVGKPGLLLMHGNGAHADWWSFIAPFFADDYRVTAFSWSGMGRSDWREAYTTDGLIREAFMVAEETGLFAAAAKPVFLGHSFGGVPTIGCGAVAGERLRAVVLLDIPILSAEQRKAREAKRRPRGEAKPTRHYASVEEALERFRFLPPQTCEHLFIADHIARTSLRDVTADDGKPAGVTWRFDPYLWSRYTWRVAADDLANVRCPFAFMWGARSQLIQDEYLAHMRGLAPPGSPFVAIPDADHHVMIDQPLAFVAAVRALLAGWPAIGST